MKQGKRSPLLLMALTVFIDFTGFGVILPLLPFWAQHLGANPLQIGLLLTAYALAQMIFLPILGHMSDRFGRRPIILWSLAIEALSFALTAVAGSFAFLLAARFIGGLGAANIGSAQAVVADTTPPEQRARGMGMIGAAIGLGFVVGPALGGGLAALGPNAPFWVSMGIALANGLLVLLFLPETHKPTPGVPSATESTPIPSGILHLLGRWVILRLVGINLAYALAFTAMEAMYPLLSQHTFGWGTTQNAYIFTYVGGIMVIMQGGLVGRLVKLLGERGLLLAGLVLLGVGLVLLPFAGTLALMLVALGILSAGSGAVSSTTSALASLSAPRGQQGETLSLMQSVGSLGRVVGPLAAGGLFAFGGAPLPFVAGGALMLLAALAALTPFAARVPATKTPLHAESGA